MKECILQNPAEILDHINDAETLVQKLIDQIDKFSHWPNSKRKLVELQQTLHLIKIVNKKLLGIEIEEEDDDDEGEEIILFKQDETGKVTIYPEAYEKE